MIRFRSERNGACAAVLALLTSAACGPLPKAVDYGVITIGGATYRLPAAVCDGGQAYQGRHTSMLLQLPLLPPSEGPGSELVMVLMVEPNLSKTRTAAEVNTQSILDGVHAAVSLNPRNHDQQLVIAPKPSPDVPPGLAQVVIDPSDSLGDDVFVRPPLSRPAEYIDCSRLGGMHGYATTPQCQQEFAGVGLRIKLTYSRRALSKWNEIERGVLNFLRDHRVGR